jgi:hypothetical protein
VVRRCSCVLVPSRSSFIFVLLFQQEPLVLFGQLLQWKFFSFSFSFTSINFCYRQKFPWVFNWLLL